MSNPKFEMGDCIGKARGGKVVIYTGVFEEKIRPYEGPYVETRCLRADNIDFRSGTPEYESCKGCFLSDGAAHRIAANTKTRI